MFVRLEDDVKKAKKATGTPNRGEGLFKKRKETSVEYANQIRQRIKVVFKELIYKLLARN